MISRIVWLIVALILLPDMYIYFRYVRRFRLLSPLRYCLISSVSVVMLFFAVFLALQPGFAPRDASMLFLFLFLFGIFIVPKAVFALFSSAGSLFSHRRPITLLNFHIPLILALASLAAVIYGSTLGIRKIEVHHETFASGDLPEEFDGYRVLLFSDAHVGSFVGWQRSALDVFVDTIQAQQADAIVFAGDLQNMHPEELQRVGETLRRIQAPDGVYSVLGNHDYATYLGESEQQKRICEELTRQFQRSLGWHLLLNENAAIRRGADSIVVAGMENDGKKPFPSRGDIRKTLLGVSDSAFVVMLQHDPTSWRRTILPQSRAQLTLSGHTHGGQVSLFGFSPVSLVYKEWGGRYNHGSRMLYVSTGISGFVPFRLGLPAEVTVITLKRK
ncbi:MAG: metallophosphoesterase [Prevotella sp.]|nr:metallophosphoesterase [Prevotella sp.]